LFSDISPFSFHVLPFLFLSFPFFFPYQWSRDSKDKTHEVDVFQVLSFSIFSIIFSLEIIQKNERMERKIKQRTLITLLYFIQFFNAKARVVQEHQIYVLIFLSSSYYLPKKEKYTKKNG